MMSTDNTEDVVQDVVDRYGRAEEFLKLSLERNIDLTLSLEMSTFLESRSVAYQTRN